MNSLLPARSPPKQSPVGLLHVRRPVCNVGTNSVCSQSSVRTTHYASVQRSARVNRNERQSLVLVIEHDAERLQELDEQSLDLIMWASQFEQSS